MCPRIGIQGILVSEKPASVKTHPGAILADSNCLRPLTKCVFDMDIIHLEIVLVDAKRSRSVIRACGARRDTGSEDSLIASVRGGIGRIPVNLQMKTEMNRKA